MRAINTVKPGGSEDGVGLKLLGASAVSRWALGTCIHVESYIMGIQSDCLHVALAARADQSLALPTWTYMCGVESRGEST